MEESRHNRYFAYLQWIVVDILKSQWRLGLVSGVFSFLGQVLQVASLGIAIYYCGLLASNESLVISTYSFETRTDKTLLIAVSCLVMLTFGSGVVLNYFSKSAGFVIRKHYTIYCTRRLLRTIQEGRLGTLDKSAIPRLIKIAKGNCMYCGRIANLMAHLFPEIILTVLSLAALMVLEPLLTLILTVVSLVGAVFVYKTNVRASVTSSLVTRNSPIANKELKAEISSLINGSSKREPFNGRGWTAWLTNVVRTIRAVEEGGLVVGIISAVLLALLMCGLVLDVMNSMSEWGRVVAYLILFKVVSAQMRKLVRYGVSINRFYPQARNYWETAICHRLNTEAQDGGFEEEDDE